MERFENLFLRMINYNDVHILYNFFFASECSIDYFLEDNDFSQIQALLCNL